MPIVKLVAEGIGPFDRLELDLSDGNGNPHLGPHILAGVNGSGKSTILRTIGWLLDFGDTGFPRAEWAHFTSGQRARAIAALRVPRAHPFAITRASENSDPVSKWSKSQAEDWGLDQRLTTEEYAGIRRAEETIRICDLQRAAICSQRAELFQRVADWLKRSSRDDAEWDRFADPRAQYRLVIRHVIRLATAP